MFFDTKEREGSLLCSQKPAIGLHPQQFVSNSVLVLQRIPIDITQRLKLTLFGLFCRSTERSDCRILGLTACSNNGRLWLLKWTRNIYFRDMKMEAEDLSDTSIAIRKPTWYHNPDDNLSM
jgi:hypothetical protein